MANNYRFRQIMATVFHCIPCINSFKCKKNFSKKDKEKREEIFARTGEAPLCINCQKNHWRCKSAACINCCRLNECNDFVCSSCKARGIDCKCVLPRTEVEYKELEAKGLTYSSGQPEPTEKGQFHEQCFFQFKDQQTVKSVKSLFKHRSMSFPKRLNGDSEQNRDYSMKPWNRCKDPLHAKDCRCDFMDRNKICNVCTVECIEKHTRARWVDDGVELGPWEFGLYRFLSSQNEFLGEDEIKKRHLEDMERVNRIIEEGISTRE